METKKNKFLEKIFYKKVYLDEVMKDGVLYKKYKKVHRFKVKRVADAVVYALIAVLFIALVLIILQK